MSKSVKLSDIAKKVGVSTVTVSKALSGQKGVSEPMREKIKELADEMGYVKVKENVNSEAYQSFNIGVLIPEQHLDKYDSFYMHLYKQLTAKAVSKDCFTMMEEITKDMVRQGTVPRLISENRVDGVIVIGSSNNDYLIKLNSESKVPLLFLDFAPKDIEADSVISDSFYGAYSLTNYLFEMGHSRIAYVGTLLSTSSITDRYLGYVKAIMEHGQKPDESLLINDRSLETSKIDPNLMQYPKDDMPTAFVCNCDLAASILIKKLNEDGYKVPEDISVVGYDNFLFPGLSDIRITTYEVDTKEMARRSINTLIKKIKGESYRKGVSIVEGHLVEKDSVIKRTE